MTLDDLERQNGFFGRFWAATQNHSQGGTTVLCWWRGVVGNTFQLKRNYSMPGPVSTAMGDCLWAGTAIGFRASREH